MTLILGRKRGMTQLFADDGTVTGVTVVSCTDWCTGVCTAYVAIGLPCYVKDLNWTANRTRANAPASVVFWISSAPVTPG